MIKLAATDLKHLATDKRHPWYRKDWEDFEVFLDGAPILGGIVVDVTNGFVKTLNGGPIPIFKTVGRKGNRRQVPLLVRHKGRVEIFRLIEDQKA